MKRTSLLIVALVLAPLMGAPEARAQDAYYRVVHVAAGDTLNIRAEADAGAEIIGSFAPGAGPIEVFETQEGWAKVSAEGRTGWASLAYLETYEPRMNETTGLPEGLQCSGTEPFWSLGFEGGEAIFGEAGAEEKKHFPITVVKRARGLTNPVYLGSGEGHAAVLTKAQCSDGMSDTTYGWQAVLLFGKGEETEVYGGCCRVAR